MLTKPSAQSNWSGTITVNPDPVVAPRTVDELRALLRAAHEKRLQVRPRGTGHSWNDAIATAGLSLDTRQLGPTDRPIATRTITDPDPSRKRQTGDIDDTRVFRLLRDGRCGGRAAAGRDPDRAARTGRGARGAARHRHRPARPRARAPWRLRREHVRHRDGATLFMAGLELELEEIRGRPLNLALGGWIISVLLGLAAVGLLHVIPNVLAPLVVTLALCTMGLGVLIPIFRDSGQLDTPFGRMVMAAGTVGEVGPIVAMSLLLSQRYSTWQEAGFLVAFLAFVALAAAVGMGARPPRMLAFLTRYYRRD